MKTAYKLILILSATAYPAFAEVIAGDSMDAASAPVIAPAQLAPAVLPATTNAVPVYAQNDDLLKRAYATNDPQVRQLIENQIRLQGGIQNLRNAQFRKNLLARLNLLAQQRPVQLRPMPIDTTTEAESIRLHSEISQLRSQLARLEDAVARARPVASAAPQVAPMPNSSLNSSMYNGVGNNMSLMLMSMLASMQQQQYQQQQAPFMGGFQQSPFIAGMQQSPVMNNYSQFYPQQPAYNNYANSYYGQNNSWMYNNNQNYFSRPMTAPIVASPTRYASMYTTPTYTSAVAPAPSTLPYRL